MKKIYILMQYYEADLEYAYDIPAACPCFAYESRELAEKEKEKFEKLNNAEDGVWQEEDCRCYFGIEETELI